MRLCGLRDRSALTQGTIAEKSLIEEASAYLKGIRDFAHLWDSWSDISRDIFRRRTKA